MKTRFGLFSAILFGFFCFIPPQTLANDDVHSSIVGGEEAARGAWPFMTAILMKGSSLVDGQFCGGTLIHAKWVVSAAHCFQDETSSADAVQVGLGLHDLGSDSGEIINVSRIIIHPDYNTVTQDNDIALLELANNSSSGTPISRTSSSTNLTGTTATAIGWGLTTEGGSASEVLRQVNLPIISNSTCSIAYGGGITDNMLCAGFSSGGKDSCQGDSGGPLVISDSGTTKLAGVTSWGEGCARENKYGVYARIAKYASFISTYVPTDDGGDGGGDGGDDGGGNDGGDGGGDDNTDPSPTPTPTDGPYGLWNGFLSMTNIVELINRSSESVQAQINIYSIEGTLVSSNFYDVGGNQQRDVVLNTLDGFSADSYGIVQVSSNIEGRIFYYKTKGDGFNSFQFAFGINLSDASTGNSYVGFNTFQPSSDLADQGNLVANWLSVVNLASTAKSFTVNKYSMSGELLSSQNLTINARNRVDIDGGHVDPGPSNVGLLEIIPADTSSPYISQLMRYGFETSTTFDFAFPLVALPGDSGAISVPLGSQFSAQNWLEVINVTGSDTNVTASFYSSDGSLLDRQDLFLNAHAQVHLNATDALGDGEIGMVVVDAEGAGKVIVEGMFYYRDDFGGITAMYGSQARTAASSSANGSFNLFLNMENYVKISNASSSAINVDLTLTSLFSSGSSQTLSLAPYQSIELGIHDTSTYGTTTNSYGVVNVRPASGSVITEVLRLRRNPETTELEYAAPTSLR